MTYLTTAVYENGILKPSTPLPDIPEHSTVRIRIEMPDESGVHAPVQKTKEELLAYLANLPVDEELADAIEEGRRQPWRIEEY